MDGLEG